MSKAESIARLQNRAFKWPIPWEAVYLIADKEACSLIAYLCVAGVPTIGWGETENVQMGMEITEDEADNMFFEEICAFTRKVKESCTSFTTAEQLGAMVSLAYNVGINGFKQSTVLKAHNDSRYDAAARAFTLWNKAKINGKLTEVSGLTARRLAEAALYMKNANTPFVVPEVQAVSPESSMAKSQINLAGAASAAVGGTTIAGTVLDGAVPVLQKIKEISTTLDIQPLTALGVVMLVAGVVVMYWRYKQRKEGWA